jgi:hypothetical protein
VRIIAVLFDPAELKQAFVQLILAGVSVIRHVTQIHPYAGDAVRVPLSRREAWFDATDGCYTLTVRLRPDVIKNPLPLVCICLHAFSQPYVSNARPIDSLPVS